MARGTTLGDSAVLPGNAAKTGLVRKSLKHSNNEKEVLVNNLEQIKLVNGNAEIN